MALILREMSSTYGRSPGGYVWAVLEPLGVISILSFCFSLLLSQPALGNNFILFYATGYLPFMLYQSVSNTVARSLRFSKPLLFYPSVTWLDSVIARFTLNSLTQIMAGFILLVIIIAVADTHTVLNIQPLFLAVFLAAALGLGAGVLNCFLMGVFPVWETIWSIVTRPLFLASGILFLYEDMPPAIQDILWFNPLVHVIGLFRQGIYSLYDPIYTSSLFCLGVALAHVALAMLLLRRHHKDILASL